MLIGDLRSSAHVRGGSQQGPVQYTAYSGDIRTDAAYQTRVWTRCSSRATVQHFLEFGWNWQVSSGRFIRVELQLGSKLGPRRNCTLHRHGTRTRTSARPLMPFRNDSNKRALVIRVDLEDEPRTIRARLLHCTVASTLGAAKRFCVCDQASD